MAAQEFLELMQQIPESAHVDASFGTPRQVNGHTIIPVAKITYGFGLGFGSAGKKAVAEGEQSPPGGGGGGGGVRVKPVAVIDVTAQGVTVHPVLDVTRVVLAGMFLAAWSVFWLSRAVRAPGRKEPPATPPPPP